MAPSGPAGWPWPLLHPGRTPRPFSLRAATMPGFDQRTCSAPAHHRAFAHALLAGRNELLTFLNKLIPTYLPEHGPVFLNKA